MTSAKMKKALFAVAFAPALAGFAAAAPQAPPPLWTGFYVGLNAGYAWGESQNSSISTLPIVNPVLAGTGALTIAEIVSGSAALGSTGALPTRSDGFIGGGQVGYNRRRGDFVAGVEADIQGVAGGVGSGSDWRASPLPPTPLVWLTNLSARKNVDYLGTLRGRFGWLVAPMLLIYGSGGLAYGGVAANFSVFQKIPGADPPDPPALIGGGAFANTRAGWTAGGGLEWLFWPNWSAKAEYLYYDLGGTRLYASMPFVAPDPNGGLAFVNAVEARARFNGHIVRAGVNYHFDWGAPP